jgi:hypothetical protein
MNKRHIACLLMSIASSLLSACGGSSAATSGKSFDLVLKATSDDGDPVGGVKFTTGTSNFGTTNTAGIVSVNVRGSDGQNLPVTASCPDGYVSPEQSSTLKLTEVRRINQEGAATLGIDITCIRKMREIVLVVRTVNAPVLPVDVGGKTVGRTDNDGTAHVKLQVDRDVRSLSVNLSTNDLPTLRPQNPSRVYDLDGQDAILLLDQSFTIERKSTPKRRVATHTTPGKHIPYKIDSGRYHGF